MTNHKIQFVGSSCGQHGNYTFYKAIKYSLHGRPKILALGDFFFIKIWEEQELINIGEAQLLWEEKNTGQILVSLRLYFLPENTPEGRCEEHGEHEVVCLSEKVVLRAEDVVNIMGAAHGVKWDRGLVGVYGPASSNNASLESSPHYESPLSQSLDIHEVLKEKSLIGDVVDSSSLHVIVLGYDKYCRMRALLKRVEGMEEEAMRSKVIKALGGFLVPSKKTRLLFCRDVFDYPELEGHELLCNHLAPKLQGRPRKRRRPMDSESESSETSEDPKPRLMKPKTSLSAKPSNSLIRGLGTKSHSSYVPIPPKAPPMVDSIANQLKSEFSTPAMDRLIEADFMTKLYKFMKDRNTAITRLPYIGYRQLNVFELFTRVQQMGGYEIVVQKKLWRTLFEEISNKPNQHQQLANQNQQAGPSLLRRHYERLLLPFENHLLQEQRLYFASKKSSKLLSQQKQLRQSKSLLQSTDRQQSERLQDNSSSQQQVKIDPSEPSVSILQPPPPVTSAIGASFKIPDGGSTTITLLPLTASGDTTSATSTITTPAPCTPPISVNNVCGIRVNSSPPIHSAFSSASLLRGGGYSPPPTLVPHPPPLSSVAELLVPKVQCKKDGSLSNDLSKRPEITITPIPRSVNQLTPSGLASLQLADLMSLNLNSSLGVSALQDLAKIAERYDKVAAEHSPKKSKNEDLYAPRMNGANQRNMSIDRHARSYFDPCKTSLPGLVSADLLSQMSALDNPSKQLLPAHQSSKILNTIALFPHTTIHPSPAHQNPISTPKPTADATKPDPIFPAQSVYSQSKIMYGKPVIVDVAKESRKRASPEIEILDLRIPSENRSKHDSDIELLDLSTRRDITVSAIPKASTSKHIAKIPQPPQITIKASQEMPKSSTNSFNSHLLGTPGGLDSNKLSTLANSQSAAALGLPHSGLGNLGVNPALLHYMMSTGMKLPTSSAQSSTPPMFPFMDLATLASCYSLLPPGLMPASTSPSAAPSPAGSNAAAAAAAHQALVAQLAQFNPMGLAGMPSVNPEAIANLGIYKNYLPQGNLPAPHFLSGLMSPGSGVPPTSK